MSKKGNKAECPQDNLSTKISAFSGASQQRMSQDTIVTMFSQPSSLTKFCCKKKKISVISPQESVGGNNQICNLLH